jgi:hypothetical protein
MCFELGDRGDGMLSDEYLETARTLHCVALEVTDRTLANQVRAVAEDCERRAQQSRAGWCRQGIGAERVELILPRISL